MNLKLQQLNANNDGNGTSIGYNRDKHNYIKFRLISIVGGNAKNIGNDAYSKMHSILLDSVLETINNAHYILGSCSSAVAADKPIALKHSKVVISQGKEEIESFTATKNKFKKTIDSKGIYKFEFSKKNYVSKHFIIDVLDIPESRKRHGLKAEVTLFKHSKKFDVGFLEKEPISIAYYDYLNKILKWDFDYNRTMVEKIIEAQIID